MPRANVDNVCNIDLPKPGGKPKRRCNIAFQEIEKVLNTKKDQAVKIAKMRSYRKSNADGWKRGFNKYTPENDVMFSPVKQAQANLKPQIENVNDMYMDINTWITNMSEQFYYDNSFLMLSYWKNDKYKIKAMIHRGIIGVDMAFFNNLENVILLGQGGFGSVYSCRDPHTQLEFAVKHLSAKFKKYTDHAKNILDYMSERNGIIRAMDSPLVVKFYYSLQIKESGSMFLFFEFCIGDLNKYIKSISIDGIREVSIMIDGKETEICQELYQNKPELLEAAFLYIFEMLSALDFLVKCNIIHQDIKPDNIMVTNTLHLKIGDFGLTYKTRAINRETNNILIKAKDIDKYESTNYDLYSCGTVYYQDFELHLMNLETDNPDALKRILKGGARYDTHKISMDFEVLEPTFLVDTWALGISAIMLLFRGFHIFDPEHASSQVLKHISRQDMTLFLINLVARKSIYENYIKDGLKYAAGKQHKDLMRFLASIFKPRLSRCQTYTKEKAVYHFSIINKMRYVDMDKIENLKTFTDRNFNRSNIHLREVPEKVRQYFESKKKPKYKTFKQLLDETEKTRLKKKYPATILDVDPGITINFFT